MLEVGHRNYVAHNARFSSGLTVFQVLLEQGLTSDDTLLDVGCGSLRVGRYLLTHLEHGNYYAIEPQEWLVAEAVAKEIGNLAEIKQGRIEVGYGLEDIDKVFPDVEQWDWVLIASVMAHASHEQLKTGLEQASKRARVVIFDTVPNGGPDNTGGWQYPQVASHYDECVLEATRSIEGAVLTKLQSGTFGEQWWRLWACHS